jgi:hypothetical protein
MLFPCFIGRKDGPEKDGPRASPRRKTKVTTAEEQERPDAIYLCDVIDVSKKKNVKALQMFLLQQDMFAIPSS